MKKIIIPFVAMLCAVLFQRCSQDNDVPSAAKVDVTFGFQAPGSVNGRQQSIALDGSVKLRVSLTTPSGDSVLLHKEFTILNFGESYVTEPVALVPGNYRITEFMLVNDSSVLYATPWTGSPLAKAVSHALPYTFGVQANKISNIDMQVLSVAEYTPEQFGYASFHATIVRPLPIAVFAMGNTPALTSSTVYILNNNDTLYTKALGATAGFLPFTLDPMGTYAMIVAKDGYASLKRTFVYNDLIAELQGSTFNVYLMPALTFKLSFNRFENYRTYLFNLSASAPTTVTVNWGDGTVTPVDLSQEATEINHTYPDGEYGVSASYAVTVTGELGKITDVFYFMGTATIQKMNIDNLPDLRYVSFYFADAQDLALDLRKNTKMERVVFGGTKLLLPPSHNLNDVMFFYTNLAPSLNQLVNNVYQNAVAKNIHNGHFYYARSQDADDEPLGILSTEAFAQLQELRDSYGWIIDPAL